MLGRCLICKKEFITYPSSITRGVKCCSLACRSVFLTGYKRPGVAKANLRRRGIKTNQIVWNKGKKMDEFPSLKRGGRKKGCIPWNKGVKVDDETRKRLAIMNASQSHNGKRTSIEIKVADELSKRGLVFEEQKLINEKFSVDFYLPDINLIIEADGDYWHSIPKNIKKDFSKNKYLHLCGYKMLRLREKNINSGNFKKELDQCLLSLIKR